MRLCTAPHSLYTRFQRTGLAVGGLLLVVAAVFVFAAARSAYIDSSREALKAMVGAVDKSVAVGVYARDPVLLRELADGLLRHPYVQRVEVLDAGGHALTQGLASAATAPGLPAMDEPLASPFDAAETIGRLRLWLDSDRLAAAARRQAMLPVMALVLLIGLVHLSFQALARRLLSQPLHRLAGELERLSPGTPDRVALPARHARDEVGVVTGAVNRLLALQEDALGRERTMREAIAAMEARYRGIFDSTSAGIFLLSAAGRLEQANPALWRLLGRDAADGPARDWFADPANFDRLVQAACQSQQPETADLPLAGGERWVQCVASSVPAAADEPARIEGVLHDITRRRQQEHAARHRAEHDALTGLKSRAFIETALAQGLRAAAERGGALTLMFIDLDGFKAVNDRFGHAAGDAVLVEASRRLRELFKRGSDLVGRLGGDELVVLVDGAAAGDPQVTERAGRLLQAFRTPFELPGGEPVAVGASVGVASFPQHADSAEALMQAADAAMYAVKQAGKGGWMVAVDRGTAAAPVLGPAAPDEDWHDPLTGLPDRRRLVQRLEVAQARLRGGQGNTAVVCLDVDHFGTVNLVHGPRVGDEVLCEAARRLRGLMRREDLLARVGSDEFAALLATDEASPAAAQAVAMTVATKLQALMAEPVATSCGPLRLQLSAGVSVVDDPEADILQALQQAQMALRRAQAQPRGSLLGFEPGMMALLRDEAALEQDLRQAMLGAQFELHLQPQVDAEGRLSGAEALLRWQHPQRGAVSPAQFIPLAEASGLIVPLGRWVLQRGCELLARLQRQRPTLRVAVNVSPVQFNHPAFASDLRAALAHSGAQASGLVLEITEGLLVADMAQLAERLQALVDLGVRLSIDDFGTGFSSLGRLRQLPLHEIKIDRSFVAGLPADAASAAIVRSILDMGRHLGLEVVAEGVETAAQAELLRELGCPLQQGWFHGRPQAPALFEQALAASA